MAITEELPYQQRVFNASIDEPSERIFRRMRESIQYNSVDEKATDELTAFIEVLETRYRSLLSASLDLEAALH